MLLPSRPLQRQTSGSTPATRMSMSWCWSGSDFWKLLSSLDLGRLCLIPSVSTPSSYSITYFGVVSGARSCITSGVKPLSISKKITSLQHLTQSLPSLLLLASFSEELDLINFYSWLWFKSFFTLLTKSYATSLSTFMTSEEALSSILLEPILDLEQA